MGEQPHLVEIIQKTTNTFSDFKKDSVASDDRILGSSYFIQTLREQESFKESRKYRKSLQGLQKDIEDFFELEPRRLSQRGRQNNLSSARAIFCFLAVVELRYSGVKVAETLGISGPSVSRAIRRGEQFFRSREDLQMWWEGLMH
jgi:chromosomal replication initiation ATPase DnaA